MSTVSYPATFPVESVGEVVKVLRKQAPVSKSSLGLHAWNVQGYLQKIILGEPDTEAIHAGPLNIDAETLAVGLETLDQEGPQAILGGGLTKKLLLMAVTKLLQKVLAGADLPSVIDHVLDGLLGGE